MVFNAIFIFICLQQDLENHLESVLTKMSQDDALPADVKEMAATHIGHGQFI